MPQLGEIRRGKEIGYRCDSKHIWSACEKCSRERWVVLVKGKAVSNICRFCWSSSQGPHKYIPKESRKCSKCQRTYPNSIKYFKRYKQTKDGLRSICRHCSSKQKHEYRKSNLKARLSSNMSCQISQTLHGKNGQHWESLVGFTAGELVKHLENQFRDGMTWNSYGVNGWHIDHIIPIAAFNFKTPRSIMGCRKFKEGG